MARLIDADALKKKYEPYESFDGFPMEGLFFILDNAPTIEAEPVKRGKWIEINAAHADYLACSVCKSEYGGYSAADFDYCPNCGARMDGGVDNGGNYDKNCSP